MEDCNFRRLIAWWKKAISLWSSHHIHPLFLYDIDDAVYMLSHSLTHWWTNLASSQSHSKDFDITSTGKIGRMAMENASKSEIHSKSATQSSIRFIQAYVFQFQWNGPTQVPGHCFQCKINQLRLWFFVYKQNLSDISATLINLPSTFYSSLIFSVQRLIFTFASLSQCIKCTINVIKLNA